VRTYWVAAVPTPWNAVANGHDAITGRRYDPSQTVFTDHDLPALHALAGAGRCATRRVAAATRMGSPGRCCARVGDRLVIHFKNLDTRFGRWHSMHFHGVHYKPTSDPAYLPGVSSRVGDLVQWDVVAIGSEHHTFHVHGHRWVTRDGGPRDTQTVGPAESLKVRWRERDPAHGCTTASSRCT
jgi:FtsP/CotA-like multicopper oxidase with cupredoxin domain